MMKRDLFETAFRNGRDDFSLLFFTELCQNNMNPMQRATYNKKLLRKINCEGPIEMVRSVYREKYEDYEKEVLKHFGDHFEKSVLVMNLEHGQHEIFKFNLSLVLE